ncbi:MAG: hypothetical protein ACRCV9_09815 [Burkholderiaceae bacterium]
MALPTMVPVVGEGEGDGLGEAEGEGEGDAEGVGVGVAPTGGGLLSPPPPQPFKASTAHIAINALADCALHRIMGLFTRLIATSSKISVTQY